MLTNEYETDIGYVVDIKLGGLWRDNEGVTQPLCIEADGPTHFYTNTKTTNATTLMKHRHLRAFGYHVISIPVWEWAPLKTKQSRKNYLEMKLGDYELVDE